MHYLSEFSPPGRVWAEFRSKILSSLSWPISSYLIHFWLKLTPGSCFLIFWIFLVFFFLQFSPTGRVWAEFGSKIILSLSRPISSYLVPFLLKITTESCFFNFFEFTNSGRVRTDRKEIILVLYFLACLGSFRLEMKPGWCLLIFRIFLHLFLKFGTRVGFEPIGRKLFLFSISWPVLARFVLNWSLDDVF